MAARAGQAGRARWVGRAGIVLVAIVVALAASFAAPFAARTFDIYFIDVEGGQSTLVVTPAGESLLVDTGFPGDGTFSSLPGDPHRARDAGRILAAAKDAGVTRIDYLLITHFHADHDGGVVELAQQIPIRTFVDHGDVHADAESVAGTLDAYARYAAVRAKGRHLEPKPGDRLPLKGVEALVVSAAGSAIRAPLAGGGDANPQCRASAVPAQEANENPRSTGIRVTFGKFRFLDVGDLTGAPLYALACPWNMVGQVDAYLVAHHGGADAADAGTLAAFAPRVAIVNNGATKGGSPELLAMLHQVKGLEDAWQLHRSENPGARNFGDEQIANLDDSASHWIKLSAKEDGSFTITNARTGATKSYAPRVSASSSR